MEFGQRRMGTGHRKKFICGYCGTTYTTASDAKYCCIDKLTVDV